jgi:transposase-like protein
MRQKSGPEKQPAEDTIRDIRRAPRRHFSAEEKIRVVLEGLRGEESITELCRREGIASRCTMAGRRSSLRLPGAPKAASSRLLKKSRAGFLVFIVLA